jgi:hypothetical protein
MHHFLPRIGARSAFAGTVLLLLVATASAQIPISTTYVFSQTSGNPYTPITGGTVLAPNLTPPNYDDDTWLSVPLGFTFNFNGRTFTTVSVQANGYLVMGNSCTYSNVLYSQNCGNPIANQVDNNVICAFYLDIEGLSASSAEVRYQTTGVAGSRVFTVQWKNFQCYNGYVVTDNFNFQIKLYEANYRIEFCYGTMTYTSNASHSGTTLMADPPVGLRGESSSDFVNRKVTVGTNTWATSTAGTANTDFCAFTTSFGPVSGLVYTWDMPVVPPPPPVELFVADYVETEGISPYTEITGGTVVATGTQDDNSFNNYPIGFTFYYRNLPYTVVSMQSNGFLALASSVSSSYTPISTGSSNDVISALGGDMQGQINGEIRTQTLGTSPNRVFVAQWKNWGKWSYSGTGAGDNFNWQIKLYETTNIVEIQYGPFTNGAYSRNTEVGLRGKNSSDYNNRQVISGSQTWLTSIRGTSNASYCTEQTGLLPTNGQYFRWRGCFVPENSLFTYLVDASGTPTSGYVTPGNVYVHTVVTYPDGASDVTVTLKFYNVSNNPPTLEATKTLTLQKLAGVPLDIITPVSIGLPVGFYRVDVEIMSLNRCGSYGTEKLTPMSALIYTSGMASQLCHVWPGDVNNDGLVNYGDRKSLNKYIVDANLRSTWLQGYARYKADVGTNPLSYMTWEEQVGLPWQTPEGCFMDADGNGVVNNFDYVVIKLNWVRTHSSPRANEGFSPLTFDMSSNFPNPFNPTTKVQYSVPEPSNVNLVVTDMMGRIVSTLVDGKVEPGVHEVVFDGLTLNSGTYIATVSMAGQESGLTFSKTVKMQLVK